jgi:hypothetical protein
MINQAPITVSKRNVNKNDKADKRDNFMFAGQDEALLLFEYRKNHFYFLSKSMMTPKII